MTSDRRSFLATAGLVGVAAAAGAAGGVVATRWLTPSAPAPPAGLRLPPVHVSRDRSIGTLVGLRPFREDGFRIEAAALGAKRLVHNYGHGGGGITLSWGSAALAIEAYRAGGNALPARAAVLGAGVIGLSTALLLRRQGVAVTVYARELPPETTSDIAAGKWLPFGVAERYSPAFRVQLLRAARVSRRQFSLLAGRDYGVSWMPSYSLHAPAGEDERPRRRRRSGGLGDLFPARRSFAPGSHPFGDARVTQYVTMMIETPVYLRALLRDLRIAGGRIVVRDFADTNAVAALPEPAVFNCTGLGAGALFDDATLHPVRGQLERLLPQPEVRYMITAGGLYMMPRRDGIILGGTYERDVRSLTPDPETTTQILDGHRRIFGGMVAQDRK